MAWEICRVCLQSGDLVSLFDCDENNELLSEKYTSCSSIVVSEDDSLPSLICLTCVDKLMSAYQFKQQCILSNETLNECILEFKQTSGVIQPRMSTSVSTGTETIRIKRENGSYLEYDIPVEEETTFEFPRNPIYSLAQQQLGRQRMEVRMKRGRGRPRKYPNELGEMTLSPYQRRKEIKIHQQSPLIDVLRAGDLMLKDESKETSRDEDFDPSEVLLDEDVGNYSGDPDYTPDGDDIEDLSDVISDDEVELSPKTGLLVRVGKKPLGKRGRGRPRKIVIKEETDDMQDQDEEDVLLKETILANSEPIPDNILNPVPKEKKKYPKKKYYYDKIHTCDQCGASFRSNASLQAHIRRHLGIKPFVCNICGYACVLNMELRRHMLRHTGLRPYQCRICDRRFGDFGSRQKHERLHLGERPYQCLLCNKNFTYSYVLANHMLTHTGEKKFSCEPCNKRFTKAHHLKYHNKVHHKEVYLQQELEQQNKKLRNQFLTNITQCSQQILGVVTDDGQRVQLLKREGERDDNAEEDEMDHDQDQDSEQHSMHIEEDEANNQDGEVIYQTSEDLDIEPREVEEKSMEADFQEDEEFQEIAAATITVTKEQFDDKTDIATKITAEEVKIEDVDQKS